MAPTNTSPPEAAADEIHSCLSVPAVYPLTKRVRFGWILEVFFVIGVAVGHDLLRNAVMGSAKDALRNAQHVIAFERWLGIYHEQAVQQFFINVGPVVIGMWNVYFETAHFLVPVAVAVYLYAKFPARYVRMRNTFLIMLFATAPITWGLFPVTPPKFMPARYGFVDTGTVYWNILPRTPLSYGPDGEPSPKVVALEGNLYGGIPSHHLSWAIWCALALWPVVRRRWLRILLPLYPLATFGAVIATANHRFIDLAASLLEVTIAYSLAIAFEHALAHRRSQRT